MVGQRDGPVGEGKGKRKEKVREGQCSDLRLVIGGVRGRWIGLFETKSWGGIREDTRTPGVVASDPKTWVMHVCEQIIRQ